LAFPISHPDKIITNKIKKLLRILKKNLPNEIKEDEEVWFFDESRFGTHSKLGHGWFKTGIRTPVKIKLGYKNFYLYSAANPKTGEEFTLLLPKVNIDCMNVFLDEFVKFIKNRKIVIVMDGAGWHKSDKLIFPRNIRIIIQPPYSPELNPIERLWQFIKNHTIKNRIYKTLEELESKLCKFIRTLTPEIIRSVCSVSYMEL
jgi:transposase